MVRHNIELEVKYHFDASHRLHNQHLSEGENEKVYGACNNMHGHRWNVIITLVGVPNKYGWVVNFKDIKKVIDTFDHCNLNYILDCIPTAENIVIIIRDKINKLGEFSFLKVALFETPDCKVEVVTN